jgi:hypothetical protein
MAMDEEIQMIGLASIGSEVATIISRYQRLGDQGMIIYDHERGVLQRAREFFKKVKKGYEMATALSLGDLDPEAPKSYNWYLQVRGHLPGLHLITKPEHIKVEIDGLAAMLTKLDKEGTLVGIQKQEIEKAYTFFSTFFEFMLGELYTTSQEGVEALA